MLCPRVRKDDTDPEEIAAPTCKTYECPAYIIVHEDNELQIWRYSNHSLWISTSNSALISTLIILSEGLLGLDSSSNYYSAS